MRRPARLWLGLAGAIVAGATFLVPVGPAGAATGGCVSAAGGSPVSGPGPHRATVVVDTGKGSVWSACISFSGTISGTQALKLAGSTIPGLNPVYEVYGGEGAAVCVLRGVGNQPPDCLSKSVDYWKYFRDGRYSAGGAGSSTVADGSIEGWRWGGPADTVRTADQGTRAVAAAPPPATTTTQPVPGVTTTVVGSGSPHTGTHSSTGNATTTVPAGAGAGHTSTTVAGTPGGSGSSSTTAPSDATTGKSGSTQPGGTGSGEGPTDAAVAAAGTGQGSGGGSGSGSGGGSGSSAVTTLAGLAASLAVVGGLAVMARRRRRPSTPAA